jgi:hypothetical protein
MNKILFITLLSFCFLKAYAGIEKTSSTTIMYYIGTIGNYPVRLFLSIGNSNVRGEYAYVKNESIFNLRGTILDGNMKLEETFDQTIGQQEDFATESVKSGYFHFVLSDTSNLDGTWINIKGNRILAVHLQLKYKAAYSNSSIEVAFRNRNPKYKIDTTNIEDVDQIQFVTMPDLNVKTIINQLIKNETKEYDSIKTLTEKGSIGYIIDNCLDSMMIDMDRMPYENSAVSDVQYADGKLMSIFLAPMNIQAVRMDLEEFTILIMI